MDRFPFAIVAHRGAGGAAPENTLAAFERAIALGTDAVELDVRLTADQVPVVFHDCQLDRVTNLAGPIFQFSYAQLTRARLPYRDGSGQTESIPTLQRVLDQLAGRVGLEIEIKGPEPEAPGLVSSILQGFRQFWAQWEVTSANPALLQIVQQRCAGLAADLLYPRSPDWMSPEIAAYEAAHLGRLAGARAVHLHPTQLTAAGLALLRKHGLQVHAWDVNRAQDLEAVSRFAIPQFSTDHLEQALLHRQMIEMPPCI